MNVAVTVAIDVLIKITKQENISFKPSHIIWGTEFYMPGCEVNNYDPCIA